METLFGIPANTLLSALLIALAIIFAIVAYSAVRYPLPFRLGIRNLTRRKSQTLLIVSGLALSTVIITSALGIGDTINYSVSSGVFETLGGIDMEVSTVRQEATAAIGFGNGGPNDTGDSAEWFSQSIADDIAATVGGVTLDASVAAIIQTLPVANTNSSLSEPAVEIRGVGNVVGDGLAVPGGLATLADDEVLINSALATELDAAVGDTLLLVKGAPTPFSIAGIVENGELAGTDPTVLWTLTQAQTFFGRPDEITTVFASNVGDVETGVDRSASAKSLLAGFGADLVVNELKADQLEAAATSAEFITTLFITFGTFSIFSGILLIFLIFSVLAAERKSELGMGRAVGLQRADLVRQFISEGLAYNFVAAFIGATIGAVAALLLARVIGNLLGGSDLNITPYVSPRSVAIGYSMGLVVSFITVSIAAIRISRVNIIAAIRDLDLPSLPRERQWTLFLRPFTVWRAALQKAGKGNVREATRLFLLAAPKAIIAFWGGLLARGPVLMGLGYLFAWVGVNVAEQSGVYGLGVSLFIIGLGQLAHWIGVSSRISFSLVGLGLVIYWALGLNGVGALSELGSNPGDFFISGMFLVGGAIVLFLYNADSLLTLFAGLLGRIGRLLPVARVAIAYPLMAKGRTATTLAMFSLIIFTLVSTTTITNTFSNFVDPEAGSGGYDVVVQTNPFNPVSADEIQASLDTLVADETIPAPTALAAAAFAPIQAQSPSMSQFANYVINGVDDDFFATQRLELGSIAQGYDSAEEVWAAIQSNPTLAVMDDFSVDRGGDPTFQPDPDAFLVSSISAAESGFAPVTIDILAADGTTQQVTVIGLLSSAPNFFGLTMNAAAAAALGADSPNRFFIRVADGADARATANAIEANFSQSGLQTSLPKEQLEASRESIRGIFYLIQGFIGLGLLVGIAALGVITIRAVVERRQQIGVLRAIGFQRSMVQNVFLFEGFFIAAMGTIIGYSLALTFAYNLYLQVASEQGLAFLPPWPTLIAIGVAIFTASLLTAWLPARSTSNIVIAEALRYE
ncbi:MAG: FtsX-like permease family protein [Anaerolineae bacterium]|nr:FtsX-like permease family protein [Anaerolineae bacterium]